MRLSARHAHEQSTGRSLVDPPKWKGKKRDEGPGGTDGVVISMTLAGDGIYTAIYTVPVTIGNDSQTFPLQVDTGSSDLWIASTSCTTGPCTSGKPKLYNPSASARDTGQTFDIPYLSGEAAGPIFWDKVVLGGYEIDSQALAAADSVINETLSSSFSGILGLALPLDSVISRQIPPVTSNAPDGATLVSNLFGITPVTQAPSQYFYSLLLERPGSDTIPSVLGIGRHPSQALLPNGPTIDPTKVAYSSVQPESDGVHFWKVELRGLTVYVNGTAREVDLGRGVSGSVFPEAILDTGVPLIIATPKLASGIWGALGINPAADGNFYVPCTMPLNMTVTLDDRSEIPLHPLDVSGFPASDPSSDTCVGLVQQYPQLANPEFGLGDIILGVPFLRNVYTVMAYEASNAQGIVGNGNHTKRFSSLEQQRRSAANDISPRLGLLGITDPTVALAEFNQVRVMKQPLSNSNKTPVATGSHKFSVGLAVLFGLLGFCLLCAVLFFLRWFTVRRQLARENATELSLGLRLGSLKRKGTRDGSGDAKDVDVYALTEYHGLATSRSHSRSMVPSEDTQKTLHTPDDDPFAKLDDTGRTKVASFAKDGDGDDSSGWGSDAELGFRRNSKKAEDLQQADTYVDTDGEEADRRGSHAWIDSYSVDQPALHGEWRPSSDLDVIRPVHQRTSSSLSALSASARSPQTPSFPLLESPLDAIGLEFGELAPPEPVGMVGVGTARRGSIIDEDLTAEMRANRGSVASSRSGQSSGPRHRPGRLASGPRSSTAMSRVFSADDVHLPSEP